MDPVNAPSWWRAHPGVRTDGDLRLGERAADRLRGIMGSWGFVFGALTFLGLWMVFNRGTGFDPYPFILLNLMLSCLAALQGAILLIAAKRADQISSELAMHDYQTDKDAAELVRQIAGNAETLATVLDSVSVIANQIQTAISRSHPKIDQIYAAVVVQQTFQLSQPYVSDGIDRTLNDRPEDPAQVG